MSILFIVNPVAGKDKARRLIPTISKVMEKTNIKYEILTTSRPREAIDMTVKGVENNFKIIVAVGGDGTVNEVTTGIINKGYGILGILPGGTGNDLARTLNIPMEPIKALKLIIEGSMKTIDLGHSNGNLFINVASIGFDSEIAKNTQKLKKIIKGKFAYTIGLLKTLVTYKNKYLEIQLDDKIIKKEILLIAIGNGKFYGGGMKICPMALVDDGYFDVCLIKNIPKLKLLTLFPSVFKGNHVKFKKYVEFHRSKQVNIKTNKSVHVNIDGEVIETYGDISFTVDDNRLDVICK